MKTIQAIGDKVIATIVKKSEELSSGIIIPDTVNQEPQGYGEVISVGEDVTTISKGDTILFHKQGGQDIILNRKIVKVLMYKEIYGILKEDK